MYLKSELTLYRLKLVERRGKNTKGQCVLHLLNKPPKVAQGFLIKHQENS